MLLKKLQGEFDIDYFRYTPPEANQSAQQQGPANAKVAAPKLPTFNDNYLPLIELLSRPDLMIVTVSKYLPLFSPFLFYNVSL